MIRVGVLVSGGGTNLQAIIDAVKKVILQTHLLKLLLATKKMPMPLPEQKKMVYRQNVYALGIMIQEKNLTGR